VEHFDPAGSDQMLLGTIFSAPVQNVPEDHPASYTIGTASFHCHQVITQLQFIIIIITPRGKAAGEWR
jgi:hypothetical protein